MNNPATDATRWGLPRSDRERARATRGTFVLHLRPIRLSRRAMRWTHTLGLGGSSLVLWLILAFTGVLMLLVYQPSPDGAYESVGKLGTSVRFGALVHGMHYWSANLLIVVVLLHTARVVFTGGYLKPRRLNWIVGIGLLLLVLLSAFTGYLLPWDQRAYWAVTIATGMLAYIPGVGPFLQETIRGGSEVGANTLLTFYTFHTTILPAVAIALLAFHFWRVRKAGGVVEPPPAGSDSAPRDATEDRVLFFPHLLMREVSQALVILAIVVLLATLAGTPVGERANPGMSPNPAKAPWYFMGFQELLIHLHPLFAVVVVPLIAVVGAVTLPWWGTAAGPAGSWFLSRAGRKAALVVAPPAIVLTLAAVLLDAWLATASTAAPGWVVRGLIPILAFAVIAAVLTLMSRYWLALGRNEVVQTIAVLAVSSFATLTIIGVFFRGTGMALTLPWGG
jgi:quinol-cytochrome oxidoreductase complex cytochrome b subunit